MTSRPARNRETHHHVLFLTSEFSQWYPSAFKDADGRTFHCAEQYMMHRKALLFGDTRSADAILQAATPDACKELGRTVTPFDKDTWDRHAREIVYEGNALKFTQNPVLWDALKSTAGKRLVEAAHYDPVWGIALAASDPRCDDPAQWQGTNWLGDTLTRLRDDLACVTI